MRSWQFGLKNIFTVVYDSTIDYEEFRMSISKKRTFLLLDRLAGKGAYFIRFKCFRKLLSSVVSDFIVFKPQIGEYLWEKGKMDSLTVGN
jgi:hypothetical protein